MSTITYDSFRIERIEVNSLWELVADSVSLSDAIMNVMAHSMLTCLSSKRLMKHVLDAVKQEQNMIDVDGNIVAEVASLQQKTKEIHNVIDNALSKHLVFSVYGHIICWFLKKSFDYYGIIITNIQEHDVDVDPDSTKIIGQFTDISDLMRHLDA